MQLLSQNPNQPLEFTQGDYIALALLATDDLGTPQNLTGATITTLILGPNGEGPVTFSNSQVTLGNQNTLPGTFVLTLGAADTANCGEGKNKQIISMVTIGGHPVYYRSQNALTVYPNIPVQ